MKEKSEKPFFRPMYVNQLPHEPLGVCITVFANKLKVLQLCDRIKIC